MKKILLLCLATLSVCYSNAQNFNQGFENANTLNNGPDKWGPGGDLVLPTDSNCIWTGADSMAFWSWDAHSGDRSYEIRVATYCMNGYSGQLKTRMFPVDTFAEQRVPFTGRPDAFTFYYKFTTWGGDILNASVRLEMADGYTVGHGGVTLDQSATGWTMAIMPMQYTDTIMPELITMHFILQNDTNLHYGTRFTVDDINMISPSSVDPLENGATLACYPVPAKDVLHLSLSKPTIQSVDVVVVDALGKIVVKKEPVDLNSGLDISDLPSGVYSLKLSTATDIFTARFIK